MEETFMNVVWVLTYTNGDVAGVFTNWKKAVARQAELLREGAVLAPLHQVRVNNNGTPKQERAENVEST
jgi:hypothetical protein